jgi:hypothetical protein
MSTASPAAVSRISSRQPTTPASTARSVRGMPQTPPTEVATPSRALARTGAACGIAYVALAVVGDDILASGSHAPAPNASRAAIAAFVANHPTTTQVWIGAYLDVLGLLAFIGFVAYLASVLRRADRDGGFLPTVVLGGGLVAATIKLASLAPGFAVLYRARDGLSPQLAAALFDMNNAAFALDWALTAVMLAGTAGVVLQTGVLPRWLGLSALVIAPLLLASVPFFTADGGPPTFLLALLWIIATSVALIRRIDAPSPTSASDASGSRHALGTAA